MGGDNIICRALYILCLTVMLSLCISLEMYSKSNQLLIILTSIMVFIVSIPYIIRGEISVD